MTERNWECPSSSGGKFWRVKREGSMVTTSWGRINTKGQTKSTDHVDDEKAKKFVENTIKKKEKEGYVEKPIKSDEDPNEEVSEDLIEPVPTSYTLPPLYNTDSKGKERVWKVWVVGNKVGKMHGEVDGKQTTVFRTYEGKNVGRSNETSAEEQANREAERDWVKQTDKGYKPKSKDGKSLYKKVQEEKVRQGGVNTNVSSILAHELRDVVIEPAASLTQSKSAATAKAAKAKKKLNNGAMPGYECDIFPMGCQKWAADPKNAEKPEAKVLKYFNFKRGVYIQKKLDGIRCLVRIVTDGGNPGKQWVVLMSRQAKQFVHLKSLREEVANFLKGYENVILDCEVYAEELYGTFVYKKASKKDKIVFSPPDKDDPQLLPKHLNFKAITSTVRSTMTDPGPLEDQMCLYVFDVVDPSEKMNQDERFAILDDLFSRKGISKKYPRIKRVECKIIHSVKEITKYHDKVAEEGYEGVVLRDRDLKYECLKKNKKSKWMRKYKYFFDQEWPILGIKRDKGVDREQFTWICQTDEGVKFYPKPEGTREMKWEWYDNKDEYIGKMLTVRYQGFEDSGKPRFPIAVAIRDYE